jgi:hypothetical protein
MCVVLYVHHVTAFGENHDKSPLVKNVGEPLVANTNYRISAQVQRKTTGNLIQGNGLWIEILTGIN